MSEADCRCGHTKADHPAPDGDTYCLHCSCAHYLPTVADMMRDAEAVGRLLGDIDTQPDNGSLTVAQAVRALCEALGYAPDDVSRLVVDPGSVQVSYVARDLAGVIASDEFGYPIELDAEHPWDLDHASTP